MTLVKPFRIAVTDAELADLRERLMRVRWPEKECVDDTSQGLQLAYAQELAEYWLNGYDWRSREHALNRFDQFTTELDGLNIHFIHQRSPHRDAFPLIITHGWPGSIVEFQKIIEPLTNPTAFGGRAQDAFHVVCPSLPGFAFSGKPTSTGWSAPRVARAWDELMVRLGYDRYGAQGGDWGAMVATELGRIPVHCAAIHTNMPLAGPPAGTGELTDEEQQALTDMENYQRVESGYAVLQATRPQTIGYSLVDSPVGQMTWIIEKMQSWMDCSGNPESVVSRDELLDNVMMYWVNAAGASAARAYWESFDPSDLSFPGPRVEIPTGVAMFPGEVIKPPRRWCEARYNITHWTEMPRGGHFAAFEQPMLFIDDVRAFFATIR
jgi:epoxide hydrolase